MSSHVLCDLQHAIQFIIREAYNKSILTRCNKLSCKTVQCNHPQTSPSTYRILAVPKYSKIWRTALLGKLTVPHVVKKFLNCHGTRRFNIVFTTVYHQTFSLTHIKPVPTTLFYLHFNFIIPLPIT